MDRGGSWSRQYWRISGSELGRAGLSGLPYVMATMNTRDVSGSVLLWIAGSMAIVPKWLDFNSKISLGECLSCQKTDWFRCRAEYKTGAVVSQLTGPAADVGPPAADPISTCPVNAAAAGVGSFVVASTGKLYRILWVIKSGQSIHVLHPFDIRGEILLAYRPSCHHISDSGISIQPWRTL